VTVARHDTAIKRALTFGPYRASLEPHLGAHVFARWEQDARTFDESVAADLVAERRLADDYTALLAGARTPFRGAEASLGQLARHNEDPDRETRREAVTAAGELVEANAERLDAIYDGLVRTRATIAENLGFARFTDVAYRRRGRVDYGPADAAAFRDDVRTHIVPLAVEIVRAQAEALGVAAVMPWDANVFDRAGRMAVAPPSEQLAQLREALTLLDPDAGALAARMTEAGLYDIEDRPGKAQGAFCTFFATSGDAFVFVKPTGTSADLGSLVHETGHAIQMVRSREQPVLEYVVPSAETGEICSMALEFLMWPYYDRFLGPDAARFRARHLRVMLTMLPYIAAVDAFQERVYADPSATPAERNAMWLEMERRYMPWLSHGDIPMFANGRRWQRQRHIYNDPFYYIDYGLAMCCALQLWAQSFSDAAGALERYRAIAARGGELPFRALVRTVGLRSPFEPGTLAGVAETARRELAARR
jgi:M3 family oligoendopeptidase